jgi:hypothetical protein
MSAAPVVDRVAGHPRDPGLVVLHVGAERVGPLRRDDAERAGVREGCRWTAALQRRMQTLADERMRFVVLAAVT